jgi:diphthine synthase
MLTFIGLGLHDERGISLRGLDEAKAADFVFAEFYTSLMPGLSQQRLEGLIGKPIQILSRTDIEEKAEENVLRFAERNKVAFLVPGDSMTATTHVDLRLRAAKKGIRTIIIHGVSAISAAASCMGLQSYKFGKTVTVPITESDPSIETPYDVIKENNKRGLHTLVLLDVKTDLNQYLLIGKALEQLLTIEQKRHELVTDEDRLVVGAARIGSDDIVVKGGRIKDLIHYDFGGAPHLLVFLGPLHFMEVEALQVFADTSKEALEANV